MKMRKKKNAAFRTMEKENKLYKRERGTAKCPSQCIDLLKNNWTHNVCNCCYCVKNSPYKTKGEKYQYFRNKKSRRESYNLGVAMGFV